MNKKGGPTNAAMVQRPELRAQGQQFLTMEPDHIGWISGWQILGTSVSTRRKSDVVEESRH